MDIKRYYLLEQLVFNDEQFTINYLSPSFEFYDVTSEILKYYYQHKLKIYYVYQPCVNIQNKVCCDAEALLRINFDNQININPMVFFRILSQASLLESFNKKQLALIAKDVKFFTNEISIYFRISINISSKNLNYKYVEKLFKEIKNYNLSCNNFAIEILEDCSFEKLNIKLLNKIQQLGIKIYLDDFGKGYSNWKNIDIFKFNCIKIADKYIKNISNLKENQIFVSQIVNYCKLNNIKCIAEHVETEDEFNYCKNINVHAIQGYYFSCGVVASALPKICQQINDKLNTKKTISAEY